MAFAPPGSPEINRRRRVPAMPAAPGMETGLVNPQGAPAAVPATQAITPQNTLRTQRILPGASARTQAASGLVNAGVQNIAGINRLPQQSATRAAYTQEFKPEDISAGPRITPGQDPRLANAQGNVDRAASGVAAYDRSGQQQTAMQRAASAFGNTAVAGRPAINPGSSARQQAVAGQTDAARGAVATADPIERERALRGEYAGALGPSQLGAGAAVDPTVSARTGKTAASVDTLRDRAMAADPALDRMKQVNDVLGRLATPGAQAGAAVDPTASSRLTGAQAAADQSRAQLAEINRRKIAEDQLRAFDLESAPAMEKQQKAALAQAAKAGRLGLGRTEEAAFKPFQEMKTSRDALLARLSAELGAGEIEDQFRREGVMSQAEQQITGNEAANRGEQRIERDYTTGLNERNLDRTRGDKLNAETIGAGYAGQDASDVRGLLGQIAGLEGQQFGQDEALRGEARTERDYDTGIRAGNLDRSRDDARTALGLAAAGGDRSVENDYARAGLLAGEESRIYGPEAADRGELRGERDFDVGLEEANINRRLGVAGKTLDYGSAEAGAGMDDVLARLDAARGVSGDVEQTGIANRGEQRIERADERGVAEGNLNRRLDQQRFAAGQAAQDTGASIDDEFRRTGLFQELENTSNAQDIQQQEALRGERGYEDYLAQDAQSDAERRRMAEEDLLDRQFNRSTIQTQTGYGGDPSGQYLDAAGQYGAEAEGAFGDVGELMRAGMYRDAMSEQTAAMEAAGRGGAGGYPDGYPNPVLDNGVPEEDPYGFLRGLDLGGLFGDEGDLPMPPVFNPRDYARF